MTTRITFALAAAALLAASIHPAPAQAADTGAGSASPGIVSHVKVLSDKVEDISSLEAWKKSFIKEKMTDQQKAIAIWTTVVKFRHQASPPFEHLEWGGDTCTHDPIKAFNVYGYGQCCCASGAIETLARYAGFEARGWGINSHSVPEINVGGKWGMFDASLVDFFLNPDKSVAGVMDINKSIVDFIARHPDFKTKTNKELEAFARNGGWRKGPSVLATGNGYDENGWLPAKTHTWAASFGEFGGTEVPKGIKPFVFDYGTAVGYEVNIQLRSGEKIVRNWANHGLHVNAAEGKDMPVGPDDLKPYAPKFGDLNTTGRVGNGYIEYNLPLASNAFRNGMLTVDNLVSKSQDPKGPALHVKDASKPGTLIFRMPSSYIYLDGELAFNPVIGNGGSITVSISDNNGLDWKPLGNVTSSSPQKIELKDKIYRRYDYRLKFEMKGAGTGVETLVVHNDIQHSQRPLPILDAGSNKIAFSSSAQEGTITVQGRTDTNSSPKNLTFADFHPIEGQPKFSGSSKVTLPIQTPGDITRIRVGGFYRAAGAKDSYTVQASFDEGKTFTDMAKWEGPIRATSKYLVFDKVPAKARSVQVRLVGQQADTLLMFDYRIDVDYKEPNGAFMPVKITYQYQEGGQAKTDVRIVKSATDNYTINCNGKPTMKSITLEPAQ